MVDKQSKEYADALRELRSKDMNLSDANIKKVMSGNADEEGILKGTMANNKDETLLPTEEMGQLDLMEASLRKVSQKAAEQGIGKGMKAVTGSIEGDLSEMSGDVTSKIINFTQKQVTSPIQSEMQQMSTLVDGIRTQRQNEQKAARNTLNTAIQTGAIANFDDEQIDRYSNILPSTSTDDIRSIKNSVVANNQADSSIRDSIAEEIEDSYDRFQQSVDKDKAKKNIGASLKDRFGRKYSDYINRQMNRILVEREGKYSRLEDAVKKAFDESGDKSWSDETMRRSIMDTSDGLGWDVPTNHIDYMVEHKNEILSDEDKTKDKDKDIPKTFGQAKKQKIDNLVKVFKDLRNKHAFTDDQIRMKWKKDNWGEETDYGLSSAQLEKKSVPSYVDQAIDKLKTAWYEPNEYSAERWKNIGKAVGKAGARVSSDFAPWLRAYEGYKTGKKVGEVAKEKIPEGIKGIKEGLK